MNEDLKPCPFCGESVSISYWMGAKSYYIECEFCGAKIMKLDKKPLIEAWNTRAAPSVESVDKRLRGMLEEAKGHLVHSASDIECCMDFVESIDSFLSESQKGENESLIKSFDRIIDETSKPGLSKDFIESERKSFKKIEKETAENE